MKLLASGLRAAHDNKRFLVGVSLLFVFRARIAGWAIVPSGSMNPALIEDDYILTNRLAYGVRVSATIVWLRRGNDPRRGDIIVFSSPEDDTELVKRLIGLPGGTVEIHNETLYINHQRSACTPLLNVASGALPQATVMLLHELWSEALPDRQHTVVASSEMRTLHSSGSIIVPQDHYLMLGDNRDNSHDSHYFSLVPRKNLIAHVPHLTLSFDSDHLYMPRLTRMGKPLDQRNIRSTQRKSPLVIEETFSSDYVPCTPY